MIIKRVKIISFAGLKDKNIVFDEGLNLIFGENERGKSSIQEFIKIWLFGIGSGRKNRVKYLPLDGGIMEGELLVKDGEKEYLIKRRFGESRKSDFVEVLNFSTGEKFDLNKREIGEVLLKVSEKTFSRTIFIGQQKVILEKERKEDEIKERLKSALNEDNDDASIDKGIEKLKEKRKEIQGSKGGGSLKECNEVLNKLNEEFYRAEKLKIEALDKEVEFKDVKIKKKNIRDDMERLEIYKKHLKRGNLKREYEEIIKYFNKNESNKKEEETLYKELSKLDRSELEDLEKKNEGIKVIKLKVSENENNVGAFEEERKDIKKENEKLDVFYSLGGNIKEKISGLIMEIKLFEDKIKSEGKLQNLIEEEEKKIEELEEILKAKNILKTDKEDINRFLKSLNEGFSIKKYMILIAVCIVVAIVGFIIDNKILIGISLIIVIGSIFSYFTLGSEKSVLSKYKFKTINELKTALNEIEEFKKMEEKAHLKIEERLNRIEDLEIEKGYEKYIQSEKMISSIKIMTESKNNEELLEKVSIYENAKVRLDRIDEEKRSVKKKIEFFNEEREKLEKEILLELRKIDEKATIDRYEELTSEYKEKLRRRNEIKDDIKRNNETYEALLKDRDINEIKKEVEVNNELIEGSVYKKEEEIDEELKEKSKELIYYEKKGKELEGEIKHIFERERDINIIEEEIFEQEERLEELRKKMKALDISIEKLENINKRLKEKLAPKINEYTGEIFSKITKERYKNVILKEDYSLEVEDERWFSSEYLSSGTRDQLYLSLRLAIVKKIFENMEVPIILDEAFSQYDDRRRLETLDYLHKMGGMQTIIFTCQGIEKKILGNLKLPYNEIVI